MLPERIVERLLRKLGLKFKRNFKTLPGKPDFVFLEYRSIVFVHGCFWHQHKGCIDGRIPKTNRKYWIAKLKTNMKRDAAVCRNLRKMKWSVIKIWECQIKKNPQKVSQKIIKFINNV